MASGEARGEGSTPMLTAQLCRAEYAPGAAPGGPPLKFPLIYSPCGIE